MILREGAASGAERALNVFYRAALEFAGHCDDEEFVSDFTGAIGLILVARLPLERRCGSTLIFAHTFFRIHFASVSELLEGPSS